MIRPNVSAILPSDIPDRVTGWGTFALPFWGLIASPVVDLHTGLPYSVLDANENYVGVPDSSRLSTYFSLDLQVYKEFDMSNMAVIGNYFKGKRFRLGIFSLNLTDHSNPIDVYNNNTSPFFGTFTGFLHRVSGFVFEID